MATNQHINERWGGWLTSSCAGDQVAYRSLLREMHKLLRTYLMRRVIDPQTAEDVAQEILLAVHKAKHTYDPSQPVAPWFFAIVHYKLNDFYRKNARNTRLTKALVEHSNAPTSAPPAGDHQDVELLLALLAELPEKQRRAIELLKLEGLSTKEAAERLDLSLSALKVTAHRGYKNLLIKLHARDKE